MEVRSSYFCNSDTTYKHSKPLFVTINTAMGTVLPSNTFVRGKNRIPFYYSNSVKFGFSSLGNCWQDIYYGMPYAGIGIYYADFFRKDNLGNPISIYGFQGGTIKDFNSVLSLNYEWNLGVSFNWEPFELGDNTNNIAIGSPLNVHFAVLAYLKWKLPSAWEVHLGTGLTHFSDGCTILPNKGINLISPFIEVAYTFNRPANIIKKTFVSPPVIRHLEHDVLLTFSTRQARIDTTGLGSTAYPFINRNFKVVALEYSLLFVNSHKYKWGPSIDLGYDESGGVTMWNEANPVEGTIKKCMHWGRPYERFSMGLSIKGEIAFPNCSMFANLGYDIIHRNVIEDRLYQILGLKLYLRKNLFGTFGVRATRFTRSQYLFWSIGYTFNRNGELCRHKCKQ